MNAVAWGALSVLALQLGCAGRVSQSVGERGAAAAGDGGMSGSVSGPPQGLGSSADAGASSAASSRGGVNLPGEAYDAGATTMSQAGAAAFDAASSVVDTGTSLADAGLSEPISDAGLEQAGLADAGCHSISRSLSCISLPPQHVCAFQSNVLACKQDTDCDWLVIPDCCCTAPRYILTPDVNTSESCLHNLCFGHFFLPG